MLSGPAPASAFCERQARMTIRSRREVVTFRHPCGSGASIACCPPAPMRSSPEETIEGLSFEAFRRIATMIKVPAEGSRAASLTVLIISSAFSTGAAIGAIANESASRSNGCRKNDPPPGAKTAALTRFPCKLVRLPIQRII